MGFIEKSDIVAYINEEEEVYCKDCITNKMTLMPISKDGIGDDEALYCDICGKIIFTV